MILVKENPMCGNEETQIKEKKKGYETKCQILTFTKMAVSVMG